MSLFIRSLILLCICIPSLILADQNSSHQNDQLIGNAISDGSKFLLSNQNPDGSWGTPQQTKGLNIYAPIPGAHRAFRLAVTALSLSALLEVQKDNPDYQETITQGKEYLVENLTSLRRATPMAIYNVWSHAYGIQSLVRLYGHSTKKSEKEKLRSIISQQITMLQKYESIDGGWGYYDFNAQTKQPSGSSISFVNATALVALKEAESIGVEIPGKMVQKALNAIRRQRLPDHSYLYGEYLKYKPRRGINRPAGSLGRSHACNLALQVWGDQSVTAEIHKLCLDRLVKRNGWLDVARKRPVPHESWFAVAGYFFYYGHLYASLCIEQLPENERDFYKQNLAQILIPLQEKDGSWWDFPFYNYHQQYGTAMALISLKHCLP
ncbi:MAG: prenyltransferase/squalene oxidase repeat-containing protein [Opitutales bacterium]